VLNSLSYQGLQCSGCNRVRQSAGVYMPIQRRSRSVTRGSTSRVSMRAATIAGSINLFSIVDQPVLDQSAGERVVLFPTATSLETTQSCGSSA
jgi:hypothetical protein